MPLPSRPRVAPSPRSFDAAFPWIVTAVFAALASWGAAHHEMWRDEMQAWLLARDSATPFELLRNMRYDGHPALWHLLLMPLTRITRAPIAMTVAHLAIATTTVFLVARHAPFTRLQRALFAFGYFPLYELAVIRRCYALGLLFVVLVCIHHPKRFARPVVHGALVFLLTQANVVAMIVGVAYTSALALEIVERRRDPELAWPHASASVALGAAGAALCILQVMPPADSIFESPGLRAAPAVVFGLPTRAVFAVPPPTFFFWNDNVLFAWPPFAKVAPFVSCAILLWLAFLLTRARIAWVSFVLGAAALLALFAFVYLGDTRHHGFFFVLFVLGAWLAWGSTRDGNAAGWRRLRDAALRPTLTVILIVHVAGAAIALTFDRRYVFSSGARAAEVLRARGLTDAPMVGEPDYAAETVIGYLGCDAIYNPRTGGKTSYVTPSTGRRLVNLSDDEVLAFAARVAAIEQRSVVIIVNRPIAPDAARARSLETIAELYDSMIEAENFYLYELPVSAAARER